MHLVERSPTFLSKSTVTCVHQASGEYLGLKGKKKSTFSRLAQLVQGSSQDASGCDIISDLFSGVMTVSGSAGAAAASPLPLLVNDDTCSGPKKTAFCDYKAEHFDAVVLQKET